MKNHKFSRFNEKCETCGRAFRDYSDLKKHIKDFHEGVKCDLCGKNFRYISDLKSHNSFVHNGVEIQKCKFCDMDSKNAGDLMRHISINHKDKGVCKICNNVFTDFDSLQKHTKHCIINAKN